MHGLIMVWMREVMAKWCKPATPGIRINTDAAIFCDSRRRGLGFIGRNNASSLILALAH